MGRRNIGPGPGKYKLPALVGYPGHAVNRYRNPQYSIRDRVGLPYRGLGPGPKYNVERMTMYGKNTAPTYSIVSRARPTGFAPTPGPAAYLPNRIDAKKPPAFSLASRWKPLHLQEIPGPDRYDLPTTIGPKVPDKYAKAAYSMSFKHWLSMKEASPGPAKYTPVSTQVYKTRYPKYSLRDRTLGAFDKGLSPGPGHYFPQSKPRTGYSFGLRLDNEPYILPDDEMPCINK